jgi:hypothetical protein
MQCYVSLPGSWVTRLRGRSGSMYMLQWANSKERATSVAFTSDGVCSLLSLLLRGLDRCCGW